MQEVIQSMLSKYQLHNENDYVNALKEIIQEICLLGLWRAKFFEKAAFYGGSALRILYRLDRFSEDLDFSLFDKSQDFSLEKYNSAIVTELSAFGFQVDMRVKSKSIDTAIESAFIKANTQQQMLVIDVPKEIINRVHRMQNIKIKMEVDTDPPGNFKTEPKSLLLPVPFSIISFTKPCLFAGKLHAILCRQWKNRVKGRDWYDLLWYIARDIPVDLAHLQERLIQTNAWAKNKRFSRNDLLNLLKDKIETLDFKQATQDIIPFINDERTVALWSRSFFIDVIDRIKILSEEVES